MPNPGPSTTQTPNNVAVMAPQSTPQNSTNVQGQNAFRLLAVAKSVNVNALGDQAVMPVINAAAYSVFQVVMVNASISLTTALAGLFSAPAASGAIVANAALSALTGPTVVSQRTVAATAVQTAQNLYLNVGTAQGAAATVDVYVYGFDLSTQIAGQSL